MWVSCQHAKRALVSRGQTLAPRPHLSKADEADAKAEMTLLMVRVTVPSGVKSAPGVLLILIGLDAAVCVGGIAAAGCALLMPKGLGQAATGCRRSLCSTLADRVEPSWRLHTALLGPQLPMCASGDNLQQIPRCTSMASRACT